MPDALPDFEKLAEEVGNAPAASKPNDGTPDFEALAAEVEQAKPVKPREKFDAYKQKLMTNGSLSPDEEEAMIQARAEELRTTTRGQRLKEGVKEAGRNIKGILSAPGKILGTAAGEMVYGEGDWLDNTVAAAVGAGAAAVDTSDMFTDATGNLLEMGIGAAVDEEAQARAEINRLKYAAKKEKVVGEMASSTAQSPEAAESAKAVAEGARLATNLAIPVPIGGKIKPLAGAAIEAAENLGAAKVVEKVAQTGREAVGATMQAASKPGILASKAAPVLAPVVGGIAGASSGPVGILTGVGAGALTGKRIGTAGQIAFEAADEAGNMLRVTPDESWLKTVRTELPKRIAEAQMDPTTTPSRLKALDTLNDITKAMADKNWDGTMLAQTGRVMVNAAEAAGVGALLGLAQSKPGEEGEAVVGGAAIGAGAGALAGAKLTPSEVAARDAAKFKAETKDIPPPTGAAAAPGTPPPSTPPPQTPPPGGGTPPAAPVPGAPTPAPAATPQTGAFTLPQGVTPATRRGTYDLNFTNDLDRALYTVGQRTNPNDAVIMEALRARTGLDDSAIRQIADQMVDQVSERTGVVRGAGVTRGSVNIPESGERFITEFRTEMENINRPPAEPAPAGTEQPVPAATEPVPAPAATQTPPAPAAPAEQPPAARGVAFTIPSELAASRPRWNQRAVNFATDLDRALYIIANPNSASARDADFRSALRTHTGMTDAELNIAARNVRTSVTNAARANPGTEAIPVADVYNTLYRPAPAPAPASTTASTRVDDTRDIDGPAATTETPATREVSTRVDEDSRDISDTPAPAAEAPAPVATVEVPRNRILSEDAEAARQALIADVTSRKGKPLASVDAQSLPATAGVTSPAPAAPRQPLRLRTPAPRDPGPAFADPKPLAEKPVISKPTQIESNSPGFPALPGEYVLVERADLVGSHKGDGQANPDYPLTNERDYNTAEEKAANMQRRQSWNSKRILTDNVTATDGPQITVRMPDANGVERDVVLGGNRRTLLIDDPTTYGKYKADLLAYLADKKDMPSAKTAEGMKEPVLVRRVTGEGAKYVTENPDRTIRALNDTSTGTQTATQNASAGARLLQTPEVSRAIGEQVSKIFEDVEKGTPVSILKQKNTAELAKTLLDNGVIRPADQGRMIDPKTGNLTDVGATEIAKTIFADVIGGDAKLTEALVSNENLSQLATKINHALPSVYRMRAVGVDTAPLSKALAQEAQRLQTTVKGKPQSVDAFYAQTDMGLDPSMTPDPKVKALQKVIADAKVRGDGSMKETFRRIAEDVAPKGDGDLFTEAKNPKGSILEADILKPKPREKLLSGDISFASSEGLTNRKPLQGKK